MEKIISVDGEVISELAPYLEEKRVSQSLLVNTILKDIILLVCSILAEFMSESDIFKRFAERKIYYQRF